MNDPGPTGVDTEKAYPSVHLAYDLALASYEWAEKRLEAADSRAQTLLALATTVTLAFVPLALQRGLSARSAWFILAIIAFASGIVLGMTARLQGSLRLIAPKALYEAWLHYSHWEFKKNLIYWAGEHFELNRALINRKGRLLTAASLSFLVEAALLLSWGACRT